MTPISKGQTCLSLIVAIPASSGGKPLRLGVPSRRGMASAQARNGVGRMKVRAFSRQTPPSFDGPSRRGKASAQARNGVGRMKVSAATDGFRGNPTLEAIEPIAQGARELRRL